MFVCCLDSELPQIQEGLSPNHLKKAKLMFFYARYPSSNMLKMFFSDVKVSTSPASFPPTHSPSPSPSSYPSVNVLINC